MAVVDPQPLTAATPTPMWGASMSSWRWRTNLPDRYEPPTPHVPNPPPADERPAEDTPAAPGRAPANRSPRFPQQPTGGQQP